jgi:hypothetical protein
VFPRQFKELAVAICLQRSYCIRYEIADVTVNPNENKCQLQLKAVMLTWDERMKNSRRSTRIIPLIKNSTSPYQKDAKICQM